MFYNLRRFGSKKKFVKQSKIDYANDYKK